MTTLNLKFSLENFGFPAASVSVRLYLRARDIAFVANDSFQANAVQTWRTDAAGETSFQAFSSPDLVSLGFSDAYYVLDCPEIGLYQSFWVPDGDDPAFEDGDLAKLVALVPPEGETIPPGSVPYYSKGEVDAAIAAHNDAAIAAQDPTAASAVTTLRAVLTNIWAPFTAATAFGKSLLTLANAAALRTAAGLGNSATRDVGTTTGTAAAGDDSRFTDARPPTGVAGGVLNGTYPNPGLSIAVEPLITPGTSAQFWRGDKIWSTLNAAAVAGLGGAATLNVGTSAGTVAAGDDGRFTNSRAPTGAAGGVLAGTYPNPTLAIDREPVIAAGTTGQYWRGDKSWQTLNSASVGLGNVDNTSDASKQGTFQTAYDGRYGRLTAANSWSGANSYSAGLVSTVANTTDYALDLQHTSGTMFRVKSRANQEPTIEVAGVPFMSAVSGQWQFVTRDCVFTNVAMGDSGKLSLTGTGGAGTLFIDGRATANYGPIVLGASTTALTIGSSLLASKIIECARPMLIHRAAVGENPLTVRGAISQTAALLKLQQYSSTSTARDAAVIDATLPTATDATRTGRLSLSAVDYNATREGMRIEADGTAARVSFYGATAVTKPTITGSRGGNAALASLLTALANQGLITDSTTA